MMWEKTRRERKEGDLRQREGFLWLPMTIGKVTRWLEHATWTEEAHYVIVGGDMLSDSYGWRWFLVKWTDIHCEICGATLIKGYKGRRAIVADMCPIPHPITHIPAIKAT